jgi:flagellar basal-body rod modification protein FlgD
MNVSSATSSTSQTSSASSQFSPDMFMKLLLAELQTQDPLSPMDTQAMVDQLSTMQSVSETRATRLSQQFGQATGMIGRTVSWQDNETDGVQTGTVSKIVRDGSEPKLVVGSTTLALDDILSIS